MDADATTLQGTPIVDRRRLRRGNAPIFSALLAITLLAWAYLLHMARAMQAASSKAAVMAAMGMAMDHPWDRSDLLMTFLMWAVMMVGMMLPSAMPMILGFAAVNRFRAKRCGSYVATAIFVVGYFAVWTAF